MRKTLPDAHFYLRLLERTSIYDSPPNTRMQPDAAPRPQDQADFGTQTHPNVIPIYIAARLMGHVSRHQQCLCYITSHAGCLAHHITLRPHVKGEADTTSAGTTV